MSPLLILIAINAGLGIVLAIGVYAALKLKIANQWHHLWLGFFAFPLSLDPIELAIRVVFVLPLCDDAVQHWEQWRRYVKAHRSAPVTTPSVQELDALFESPLHKLYAWAVQHL
jgi:hypothetical protein